MFGPVIRTPLTLRDRERIEQAIAQTPLLSSSPLTALAFAPHLMWRRVLEYSWAEVQGWLCVFAKSADGLFMVLPPLGPLNPPVSSGHHSWERTYITVLSHIWTFMETHNQGTPVTRIENIPEELVPVFADAGFRLKPKDAEYVYCTRALIELKGNRYKAQRAACNRFIRSYTAEYRSYRQEDREACLRLCEHWIRQKHHALNHVSDCQEAMLARMLLHDARGAHAEVLTHHDALGLTGRVLSLGGTIVAYTFGFPRTPEVFCVLLEVADRTIAGAAQYLFREFCREHGQYLFTNTMDDSGLASLASSKRAYHPIHLVQNYLATRS
ncbi:MAG: DUF2156 domain-containing protein [Nitrospirae bacterium]|nr:MAG: DUF2156 domain-containing protein [Nitrospirota bacterium]